LDPQHCLRIHFAPFEDKLVVAWCGRHLLNTTTGWGGRAQFEPPGARLRTVREGLGLSQLELSRRSGIAQESLSRIETGRRDPRLGTLQRLARGLGLSLEQLMGRLSAAP
jgi:DNA-binding XRE family transcriptional regulator